jgi:hypothetical protein
VFRASSDPGPNPELSVFSLPGPAFATALDSLAAFETAPLVINSTLTWNGAFYADTNDQLVPQPLFAHLDVARTITFTAGDATRGDNFGGVSLRFTAVPEPASWALLLVGFFSLGSALRTQRGRASVRAAA